MSDRLSVIVLRPRIVGRLAQRGIGAQLATPLSYLAVVAFYLLVGWLFRTFIIAARTVELSSFFDQIEFLLVFVVPVLTMRAFSDELRNGSLDLLWVRGLRTVELVLGKFVASAVFVVAMLAVPIVAIGLVTAGAARLDAGTFMAQAAGLACVALVLVALGIAMSATSGNPLIAAMGGSAVGLFLWFLDLADLSPVSLQRLFALRLHLVGFQVGEVRLEDLVFFSFLVLFWLLTTVSLLRWQRIQGGA